MRAAMAVMALAAGPGLSQAPGPVSPVPPPPLPGAPPPPPPPIVFIPPTAPGPMAEYKPQLVDVVPGQVKCGDEIVAPVAIERPFPVLTNGPVGAPAPAVAFAFRIDETGRPLGIAQERDPAITGLRLYYNIGDVAPAFAASRFQAGKARRDCRISFEPHLYPVTAVPAWLAHRYFVAPHTRQPADQELFRAMHAPNTNCIMEGTPKVRSRAFPDFEKIPQARATWAYAMTTFDIDAAGKPVNVRIASSDGNATLDRVSIEASRQSRYAPEARHGCTYPYFRMPVEPLEAPKPPERASFIPADAKCNMAEGKWAFMPPLTFPGGFLNRHIEGWALIGYDVAPWGATGNLHVLAAEPAAAFGDQAMNIVRSARQEAAQTGMTGCVTLVRFVVPQKKPGG
jgi:TonB family protein